MIGFTFIRYNLLTFCEEGEGGRNEPFLSISSEISRVWHILSAQETISGTNKQNTLFLYICIHIYTQIYKIHIYIFIIYNKISYIIFIDL